MALENILVEINQSALKFLMPLSLEVTYSTIVDEAVKLVGAKFGSILLEKNDQLIRVYGSANFTYSIKNRKRGNTYKAFKTQKTIVAYIKELGLHHPILKKNNIKGTVFIPLSYQGKSIGVLSINSVKIIKLSDEELRVLELFGSMASLAIKKVQLYKEMHDALKARDMFISMASHELKTPLTTIHGYVELLGTKFKKTDTSEGRWVQNLSLETKRLINLVNELLETNNIKTGKLTFSWTVCSLREVIRRAVNNFHITHPHRIIYIEDKLSNHQDNISGDFNKLLQVFSNLINNSLKFSPDDSAVQITLTYEEPYYFVKITDQGKGIDKKDILRIFDEFYKGSDQTVEGMGLGLFLVKKIIAEHKGTIEAFSQLGRGTSMVVKLPEIKI
jgi:K+-sensing histidine kinase KdpD